MRIYFIWLAVVLGSGLLIWLAWLILGRVIATSVGRHFLSASIERTTGAFAINEDGFIVGERSRPLPRSGGVGLKIVTDSKKRLLLSVDGDTFTLGLISKIWAGPKEPQYQFSPEAGDVVSFVRSTSRFAWPASPFRYSIMGAKLPGWHRYVYDRLAWKKVSGAVLEIIWRDEQNFYAGTGWTDTNTNELASVALRHSPYEDAVIKYLVSAKGWNRGDYRFEWSASDQGLLVVTVIVIADESALQPGGGKSVQLLVDPRSGNVVKELTFQ